MIIVRHLRIGNFVARNDSEEFVISEVLGIARNFEWEYLIDSRNSDGRRREAGWISATKCDPIILTPEWLERCGFNPFIGATIDDNKYYLQVGNNLYLNQYVRSGNWCVEPEGWNNEQTCWLQPQFVHQLQNLYFALTGEELQIKMR